MICTVYTELMSTCPKSYFSSWIGLKLATQTGSASSESQQLSRVQKAALVTEDWGYCCAVTLWGLESCAVDFSWSCQTSLSRSNASCRAVCQLFACYRTGMAVWFSEIDNWWLILQLINQNNLSSSLFLKHFIKSGHHRQNHVFFHAISGYFASTTYLLLD